MSAPSSGRQGLGLALRVVAIVILLGLGALGILGAHPAWVQSLIIEALRLLAG